MELLSKKELAKKLKVAEITINRLLAKGMPKIKVGHQVRFDFQEVDGWLKQNGK